MAAAVGVTFAPVSASAGNRSAASPRAAASTPLGRRCRTRASTSSTRTARTRRTRPTSCRRGTRRWSRRSASSSSAGRSRRRRTAAPASCSSPTTTTSASPRASTCSCSSTTPSTCPRAPRFEPPGPLGVRVKLALVEEKGWRPAVTLVPWVFLPVAPSQSLRGGPLLFGGWELPAHLESARGQRGGALRRQPEAAGRRRPRLGPHVHGRRRLPRLRRRLRHRPRRRAGRHGALWAFTRDMQVDLGTYVGLAGNEPLATPFLGFSSGADGPLPREPCRLLVLEERPLGFEERPFAFEERPLAFEERPLGFEERLLGFEERPLAFEERPLAFEERLLGFEERLLAFEERPLAFEERLLAFEERLLGFEERPLAFEERPLAFEERLLGLEQPLRDPVPRTSGALPSSSEFDASTALRRQNNPRCMEHRCARVDPRSAALPRPGPPMDKSVLCDRA